MSTERTDVVVVGAGAAGLASALALRRAGMSVVVLEARNRVGGRIATLHTRSGPVELGAEFVHGRAEASGPWIARAGVDVLDVSGTRWRAQSGRLSRFDDFWPRLERVMRQLPSRRARDRSFDDALKGRQVAAGDLALARAYVQGFHAADRARVSAHALKDGGSPGDDVRERRLGRIGEGYDRVLAPAATALRGRIRLSSVVRQIAWTPHRVRVACADGSGRTSIVTGRAVVVTVPVGVLRANPSQRGAIAFDPPLTAKSGLLARVAMGHVRRISLAFDEPFWSSDVFARRTQAGGLNQLSFLHGTGDDFVTWWTAYPSRRPLLVGWCGGPPAETLRHRSVAEVRDRAVGALARDLGLRASALSARIEGAWTHDWDADPFARGAYSYQLVGGAEAPAALARPVQQTIFFAGEATDTEGATGTVHGAIASGARAARQVLRVLDATPRGSRRNQP